MSADRWVGVQRVEDREQLGRGEVEGARQPGDPVQQRQGGRPGRVAVEGAGLPQRLVVRAEPVHDLGEVGVGEPQRADDAAAERGVARREQVAGAGERAEAAVRARHERRPADDRLLDRGGPAIEGAVEQVGRRVAVADPEGVDRGHEAADDVDGQVERRREVADHGHGPDRGVVERVGAQGAQHEVEVDERQPGDAGQPHEPVDAVEPPPGLGSAALGPHQRVLVGGHRYRGAAGVDEELRRPGALGAPPVVDGRGAEPAKEQVGQLGRGQASGREEPVDRPQRGDAGAVEPVVRRDLLLRGRGGRHQLGEAAGQAQVFARDDVRVAVRGELPVQLLGSDPGELQVGAPAQVGQREGQRDRRGERRDPVEGRVGVLTLLDLDVLGQHLVHDVQVGDLGEGVRGVERDLPDPPSGRGEGGGLEPVVDQLQEVGQVRSRGKDRPRLGRRVRRRCGGMVIIRNGTISGHRNLPPQ